jgi:hypothetical protein
MSVKIPAELQEFIKGKQGWVATASKDGKPNLSIKGSLKMLDEEHLLFSDVFSVKTRKNLLENPQVAIMVYDAESRRGYMFQGTAELLSNGSLYDQTVESTKKAAPQMPATKYVVKVSVESIYDQSAPPNGGKQIA